MEHSTSPPLSRPPPPPPLRAHTPTVWLFGGHGIGASVNSCHSDMPSSLQATQERKVAYVLDKGLDYHPDRNHASTVYAGTVVQQVRQTQGCTLSSVC